MQENGWNTIDLHECRTPNRAKEYLKIIVFMFISVNIKWTWTKKNSIPKFSHTLSNTPQKSLSLKLSGGQKTNSARLPSVRLPYCSFIYFK